MRYTMYYQTTFGLGSRKFKSANLADAVAVAKIFAERNIDKRFTLFAEGTAESVYQQEGDK